MILFCGLTGCRKEDFRLIFSHQLHVVDNEIECAVCHEATDGGMTIPGHEICSGCHEIDEEHPSADCLMCHQAKAPSEIETKIYSPEAEAQRKEIIFSHKTPAHSKASCDTCHIHVSQAMNTKELELPQLQTCVPCHNGEIAPLKDCSLCHADSSPINGTHKLSWINKHGIESKFGNAQCFVCHTQTACIECHRDEKPLDHNASWRRITHGAQAAWNRTRCMACHQEDFCERCHEHAEPFSHHGGWVSGPTRHCFVCHFPISSVPCSTCHKAAPHATAPASPHPPFVGFDCAECHPGGIPGRPPHPNPGVLCTICHPRR
jgi:hypothetical protein